MTNDEPTARADRVLARPPRPPSEPGRFSSDSDVGPGIYPDGPPMVPASRPDWTDRSARQALEPLGRAEALAWYDRTDVGRALPDPGVRAAVAALHGTVAEPAVEAVLALPQGLTMGTPERSGRIAGLDERGRHVLNRRYRHEHPALLSGAVAHEVLAAQPAINNAEEVLLHGVVAMVHLQLVAAWPPLADLGTELARRVSSLAVTLFNSRPPGSARFRLRAPDGPGTIPGGAASMQSPDFWSLPFTSADGAGVAPAPVRAVLAAIVDEPLPDPFGYDQASIDWLDDHLTTDWLDPLARVRVGVALGLLDGADPGVAGLAR
jgi:hypothetical protein